MKKKILIGSIIAVAIIVLSSFSSVVGKVSSDEELVEFDVEFSGLGKKHTVSLTQQEAVEVELLFDDIKNQLDNIEPGQEFREIVKWGIIELGKLGLFENYDIEKIQDSIFSKNNNEMIKSYNNPLITNIPKNMYGSKENFNCEIVGETTNTCFFDGAYPIRDIFWSFINNILVLISENFGIEFEDFVDELIYHPILLFISVTIFLKFFFHQLAGFFFPISINETITFGSSSDGEWQVSHFPSEGWVNTNGSNGLINWEGSLKGQLGRHYLFIYSRAFIGATGFSGIKLFGLNKCYYIGNADHVSLDTYYR